MEGTIGKLFEGRIHNFVECINVDYTSTREEVYADLQLLVKGCKNMYDSFDKYVEIEKLDGQNQYMAEGHGLQVGFSFSLFPCLSMKAGRDCWKTYLNFIHEHTSICFNLNYSHILILAM